MSDERTAEEWGRAAVSLTGWRWLMGARARYFGSFGPDWVTVYHPVTSMKGERGPMGVHHGGNGWPLSMHGPYWPDPDDPATAGCLLVLLGHEGWRMFRDVGGDWLFFVDGPGPDGVTHGTGHALNFGPDLGRACIAAAEALGRWPGDPNG